MLRFIADFSGPLSRISPRFVADYHERALVGSLAELAASPQTEQPRGEYVVVVGLRGETK